MRSFLFPLLFITLCLLGRADAQTINFDRGYALVFPKNGIGFPVRSLQLYGDSIICLSPELKVYAKSDIGKIMVRNEKQKSNGIGTGAIVGTYAMHYIFGRATNQPGAFLATSMYGDNDNASLIWTTLLGVALGGGLGYLIEAQPGHSYLSPYVFAGSTETINEQWKAFAQEITHVGERHKFHLTLSGGSVSTPTGNGYRQMLEANGFDQFEQHYYGGDFFIIDDNNSSVQSATKFNLVRKAAIEYSFTDNIRAGLAVTWLGEPALFARKGQPFVDTNQIYEFLQRLDGKGYYATGGYHYYLTAKKDLEINATLGLGLGNMNHEIKAWYRRNSNDDPTEAVISDTRTYFSMIASGGISYHLYDNLTLGLSANYFYSGSAVMDKMFLIDIPAMDVIYSTTDIGFSLGMHF